MPARLVPAAVALITKTVQHLEAQPNEDFGTIPKPDPDLAAKLVDRAASSMAPTPSEQWQEPTHHPLAVEQRTGITQDRVREIAVAVLHPSLDVISFGACT